MKNRIIKSLIIISLLLGVINTYAGGNPNYWLRVFIKNPSVYGKLYTLKFESYSDTIYFNGNIDTVHLTYTQTLDQASEQILGFGIYKNHIKIDTGVHQSVFHKRYTEPARYDFYGHAANLSKNKDMLIHIIFYLNFADSLLSVEPIIKDNGFKGFINTNSKLEFRDLPKLEKGKLEIYTILGQKIVEETLNNQPNYESKFNFNQNANGIYIWVITDEKQFYSEKINWDNHEK